MSATTGPATAAPMPRHGHRWIDILQKERGQAPMIDVAYRPDHVQPLRQRAVPCQGRRRREEARGRDRHHRSGQGEGTQGSRRRLPVRPHLVERRAAAAAALAVRRPSHRPGRMPVRGELSCPTGAMRAVKIEDDEMARLARERASRRARARARHASARLLSQSVALRGVLHRRHAGGEDRRRRRLRRRRDGAADEGRRPRRRDRRATITATSSSTGLDENSGRYRIEIEKPGFEPRTVDAELGASIFVGTLTLRQRPG